MRTTLCILLIVLAFTTHSQSVINQAPKKTYKIIVKNELNADDNFKLVGQTLLENNYTIEVKDREFYTIKSAMKPVPKSPAVMFTLFFMIKDKAIIVTGKYDLVLNGIPENDSRFEKIENKGMKGSPTKDAYLEMENFASKFGSNLEFIFE